MQSTTLNACILLSLLIFCSCSNPADTAQVPEMAPAIELASQVPDNDAQPAKAMLKQRDLFGNEEPKGSQFAGDPLLGTQGGLGELNTGSILPNKQADFSQEINFDAK